MSYKTFNHNGYAVKNVKSIQGRDDYCFSCSLYKDDKKIAIVENSGDGGSNRYHFIGGNNHSKSENLLKEAQKMLKTDWYEAHDELVGKLMDDYANGKYFKKCCNNKTLFNCKGDKDGEFRVINAPYSKEVVNYINQEVSKEGKEINVILNEII
jgi:hypothetical protein